LKALRLVGPGFLVCHAARTFLSLFFFFFLDLVLFLEVVGIIIMGKAVDARGCSKPFDNLFCRKILRLGYFREARTNPR